MMEDPKECLEECDDPEIKPKKSRKRTMQRAKRSILLIIGILMAAAGAVGTFIFSAPQEQEKKEILSAYTITTDADYRVHLLPNQIFSSEWLEEGKIYSSVLTDYVEIKLRSAAATTENIDIKGSYKITAVLEGYSERQEMRKIIYERRYPIGAGEFDEKNVREAVFEEKVKVRPIDHRRYAENAEQILGGSTARELYILFEGNFVLGEEEKTFSHKILIPVSSENYYDITKPEQSVEQGEIVKSRTEIVTPPLQKYIGPVIVATAGLLILLSITFFTTVMEGDELWEAEMIRLIKKYGSRMICVEKLPSEDGRIILRLKEMSSMIALSEELREPVLYCVDDRGFPIDGKFYILGGGYVYLLQFPKPSTTLVEDREDFSTQSRYLSRSEKDL